MLKALITKRLPDRRCQLAVHIEQAKALIQRASQQSEACQRLEPIPGIGPLTATALIAAIGNGAAFRKGREFAAWVGLVPREHSTGGKQKLLGISKRGNCYLRKLFVQGARAVLKYRDKQCSGLKHWLAELSSAATTTSSAWHWPTRWHAWHGPADSPQRISISALANWCKSRSISGGRMLCDRD